MSPLDIIKKFGPAGTQLKSDAQKGDETAIISDFEQIGGVYESLKPSFSGSDQKIIEYAEMQVKEIQEGYEAGKVSLGEVESLGSGFEQFGQKYTK